MLFELGEELGGTVQGGRSAGSAEDSEQLQTGSLYVPS